MGTVKFFKSKTLADSLTDSSANVDNIYFPTDGTSIVMGGKEYGVGGGSTITVEDSLTSTSTTNALSANQGKVLNDAIGDIDSALTAIIG